MGRYLSYVLLDKDEKEIKINRYDLARIDESYHIGNVYELVEYHKRGSAEEYSFTLQEIKDFINDKAQQYTYIQLLTQTMKYECDDLFTELILLSLVYENAIKLIKERNIEVSYVHFRYY